jgi:hypothetical protein
MALQAAVRPYDGIDMSVPGKTPDTTPDAKPPPPTDAPAGRPPKRRRDKSQTEIGGREGPDPTRYGDWEKNGRAVDF